MYWKKFTLWCWNKYHYFFQEIPKRKYMISETFIFICSYYIWLMWATLNVPLMSNDAAARKTRQSSERCTFPSIRGCSSECSPITGDRIVCQSYESHFLSFSPSPWRRKMNAILRSSLRVRTKMVTGVTFDVFNFRYRRKCTLSVPIVRRFHYHDNSP